MSRFCKAFDPGSPDLAPRLARFRPGALAGSYFHLAAVGAHSSGLMQAGNAIIVFSTAGDDCITDVQRDYLWEVFGVPIFEQILSIAGDLLASECEAHDGLHIAAPKNGVVIEASLIEEKCACGRPTPRLAMADVRAVRAARVSDDTLVFSRPRTEIPA